MPEHPRPASHQICDGLKKFLAVVGKTLISLLIIAVLSITLVLPTWYFATSFPETYTWSVFLLTLLGLLISYVVKVRRESRKIGLQKWFVRIFLPGIARKLPSLYLVFTAMGCLIFIVMETPAPAALSGFLFFLGLGLHLFR